MIPFCTVESYGSSKKGNATVIREDEGKFSERSCICIGPWRIIRTYACEMDGVSILEEVLSMAQIGGKANSEYRKLGIVSFTCKLWGEK